MQKKWDSLWINATIATGEAEKILTTAAIAVNGNKIEWVGAMSELEDAPTALASVVHDVSHCCITPGLIDCHTHLIYAGNRANEFKMRLQGVSYQEIAAKGGGIQSTVESTRKASEDELLTQSIARAHALMLSGVTTLEIKSGYGLDLATEMKMLRVAKKIENLLPVTIYKTFLGAHTVPKDYQNKADSYVDYVCNEMLPRIAEEKLAEAVDVFCETIAFNLAQTERVFSAAKKYNLAIKCHSEQLSNSGSAALAAKYQALSVDHLEYVDESGIKALASANTVAVLLPGAFYFLRETKFPPIDLLRQYQVPIAIASDCNPGTSPVLSLPLMMNMACVLFRLTPSEALTGVTKHGAKALGIEDKIGTLQKGKIADMIVWNNKHPDEIAYNIPNVFIKQFIKNGVLMNTNSYKDIEGL